MSRRRLFDIGILTLALAASAAGCRVSREPAKTIPPAARQSAPAFTLPDLAGRPVSLDEFKGRVVLIDFWATWCPPCRVSIPAVEELHRDYAGAQFEVVSINVDEDKSIVEPFVEKHGMKYPVLLAVGSEVPGMYQVRGVPSFYLLDRQGRVAQAWIGFDPRYADQWRQHIDQLLAAS
jgi:cytochrome c biogenesis protein CcmG, thiol:disulfide interchange protein DsbE